MFPLYTKTFPATAAELERLLNGSVQRVFSGVSNAVGVSDRKFPDLAAIKVTLDGAELRSNPPAPPRVSGSGTRAITVEELQLQGSGVTIGPARTDLELRAHDVQLHHAVDSNSEIVLVVQSAREGVIRVTAATAELERAIATLATNEAGKQGVNIDQVQLTVRSRGPRSIDAEVQLRGRKLFFTTVIRLSAKLDLDEELNARVSGVTCDGDGAVGAMACSVLAPHLQKVNGRTFPLMALPLGAVRLHDVQLAVGDKLMVSAAFGA